jgi:hypothetical protein
MVKISAKSLRGIKLQARESMASWRKRRQSSRLTSKKPLKIVVDNVELKLKRIRMSKSKPCKSSLRKILRKKEENLMN